MINLMIGQGQLTASSPSSFNQIYWDGNKELQVEIDFGNGEGFVLFSTQELTYIPYVRHREIIATSTLDVDGITNLNNNLIVDGTTLLNDTLEVEGETQLNENLEVDGISDLNSDLNVLNQSPTYLSGDLTVDGLVAFDGPLEVGGDTQLYADLTVDGTTNLNGELYVNNGETTNLSGDLNVLGTSNFEDGTFENLTVNQTTDLLGTLDVDGTSTFDGTLNVNASSNLNGAVVIDADLDFFGGDLIKQAHPLRVKGSRQGIHIELSGASGGTPNNSNNFVSFSGANNTRYGRIEGQTTSELTNSFVFVWYATQASLETAFQLAMVVVDLIGIDDGDAAIVEGFEMVDAIANWAGQNLYALDNVGVSFSSGFGDYAEWLEKIDKSEMFSYGDIIGVDGGKISKNTKATDHYMVISQNPIVIGNMPEENYKNNYEKVAFMGQVPVKVLGKVSIGDYIIPSGFNDGIGRAINPKELDIVDYGKIVGVSWSESKGNGMSLINLAVGINANDTSEILQKQNDEINLLKSELNSIIKYINSKDDSSGLSELTQVTNTKKKSEQISKLESNKKNLTESRRNFTNRTTTTSSESSLRLTKADKYEEILQMLEENPDVLESIMLDARELLVKRGIDYELFEQTRRIVTEKEYLLNHLRQLTN
jgi:cytoskeletal protein CcmA (bactofilin family)